MGHLYFKRLIASASVTTSQSYLCRAALGFLAYDLTLSPWLVWLIHMIVFQQRAHMDYSSIDHTKAIFLL